MLKTAKYLKERQATALVLPIVFECAGEENGNVAKMVILWPTIPAKRKCSKAKDYEQVSRVSNTSFSSCLLTLFSF